MLILQSWGQEDVCDSSCSCREMREGDVKDPSEKVVLPFTEAQNRGSPDMV